MAEHLKPTLLVIFKYTMYCYYSSPPLPSVVVNPNHSLELLIKSLKMNPFCRTEPQNVTECWPLNGRTEPPEVASWSLVAYHLGMAEDEPLSGHGYQLFLNASFDCRASYVPLSNAAGLCPMLLSPHTVNPNYIYKGFKYILKWQLFWS